MGTKHIRTEGSRACCIVMWTTRICSAGDSALRSTPRRRGELSSETNVTPRFYDISNCAIRRTNVAV